MPTISKRISPITGETTYQAKVRVTGYPPASATFSRKTDAQQWAQRTEAEMREDKYFPNAQARKHTVPELIDRYLDYLKVKNPRRHDDVKRLLEWWKAEAGQTALAYFKTEQALEGQCKLLSRQRWGRKPEDDPRTISPATVNRYTVALHTAFTFGIKTLKWIEKNPLDGLDKLKEPNGRTRYLRREGDEDEIGRLLAACRASKNRHLFAVVLIAIATGARRSEIQHMRWIDVNEACTAVTLPKTKNGEIRTVAFGRMAELVRKMREEKEDGQIFLFPSPNDPKQPLDFRSAWRFAVKEAKLDDFHFHDLRHTCGSYLAMNKASLAEIAAALGHKTLAMVKRLIERVADTYAIIGFHLARPLGDQLEAAEAMLRSWKAELKRTGKIKTSGHAGKKDKWLRHLRVLDALRTSPPASYADIAQILGGSKNKDATLAELNRDGDKFVTAARRMMHGGYLNMLLFKGS